jgi:hypothetical protein
MRRTTQLIMAILLTLGFLFQTSGLPAYASSVATKKPLAPRLISPTGDISNPKPFFRWVPTPGATQSYLVEIQYLGNRNKIEIIRVTKDARYCAHTLCKLLLLKPLREGIWAPYRWRVTAKNAAGYSDPSQWKYFELYPQRAK